MKQCVLERRRRLKRIPGEVTGRSKFGSYGAAVMTHQQVANAMGISKARVHQLERMAFYKIRLRMANEIKEMQA